MFPFMDENRGVASLYSNVTYGDPGTAKNVIVELPWKYWTVTLWVSKAVAL
jgi:hypothetical protein